MAPSQPSMKVSNLILNEGPLASGIVVPTCLPHLVNENVQIYELIL